MQSEAKAPETRYARSGPYNIAYQVIGEGPFDLLWIPGFVSNIELAWEEPLLAHYLTRLARFSRLILFDKRGTGMSDRVPLDALPTLEERMQDLVVVLGAVGSDRAALFSDSEGGNLATLFAATKPSRTIALVTAGIFAKRVWSPDYPWAPTPEQRAAEIEATERDWGGDASIANLAPSAAGDPALSRRLSTYFRRSASPGAAAALMRMNTQIDIRGILPTITVPTLVIHRTGDRDANVEEGRWIARQIPGSRFLELPGEDHIPWVGDQDGLLDAVEQFLTGSVPARAVDRVLATVLFIDIVGSTQRAAELGDARWTDLLDSFFSAVRRELERHRGREVDTTGDGLLATFDGPARAVRCAFAIQLAVRALGLEVRAGVHTGEVELGRDGIKGIAVHIGARVAAIAGDGEVWTSSIVRDLVSGSGLVFDDRGTHILKGVPDPWRLFKVGSA
jgi:class 3 adenylate cyclase/pimeloyl-ACP methyl ester carboxylesterase